MARELEWVRSSAKARQAKSKARMNAYEEMAAAAEREKITTAQIRIPPGPRLGGSVVIEAEHLNKAFGDKLLIEDLSFKLPPGGIVGVIGPNGAGKTTLFKMITGQEQPDGGTIKVGETVKLGYVDQPRRARTQQDTSGRKSPAASTSWKSASASSPRAYVGAFNFKGGDQQKKVGQLSGGERNRVHLAKMLKEGSTSSCSTNRPTTSTSKRCRRWKRRWKISPAAPSSSATIAGSSTAWPPHPRLRRRQPCRMVRRQLREGPTIVCRLAQGSAFADKQDGWINTVSRG
jgi:RecA/RadA recombinase